MAKETACPPRFSIITPAYNAEPYVGAAIRSVLELDVSDWEMIVVDDGSTDGTVDVVASYADPRVRLFQQENAGQSAAQNNGLRQCRGEFVSFLDSDDCYRPDAISRLYSALAPHPEACLAYGGAAYMSESGQSLTLGKPPLLSAKPSGAVLHKILARNFISNGGTVLARHECIMKVGGFNADIVMAQDWELWCKMALKGMFVFAGHEPIIDYRLRSSSVARTAGISPQAQFEAIEAVFDNPAVKAYVPTKTLKRLRQKRKADAWLFVATEALRGGNWAEARRAALSSICQDTGRIRSWVTLALASTRRLPSAAKERLGVEEPN